MAFSQFPATEKARPCHRIASITTTSDEEIRLNYIDSPSDKPEEQSRGVILLIHGFPQTSYQFRHIIPLLSKNGFRVIAPDYGGAGQSSKPLTGYHKTQMAEDLHILIQSHLGIKEKIHVVGHDIGVSYGVNARYLVHHAMKMSKAPPNVFHFVFHQVPDLPEFLIAGKEREYLKHFLDKISYNSAAISPTDLDHYALAYSQPGAIRASLEVYRAFEKDAEENRKWVSEHGKVKVPSLLINGEKSMLAQFAQGMAGEYHEGAKTITIGEAAHYIAEENPTEFEDIVSTFIVETTRHYKALDPFET